MKGTFKKKLFIGFLAILALMASGILISISRLADFNSKFNTVINIAIQRIQTINQISSTILDIHRMEEAVLRSGASQEERQKNIELIDQDIRTLESSLARLHHLVDPYDRQWLKKVDFLWKEYLAINRNINDLRQLGEDTKEIELKGHQTIDETQKILADIMSRSYQKLETERAEAERGYLITSNLLIGFLLMATISGMLIAAFTSRGIIARTEEISEKAKKIASGYLLSPRELEGAGDELDPVYLSLQEICTSFKNITRQAQDIARDDLSSTVELRSQADELGRALQDMTRSLRKAREENRKQSWLRSRQNELYEKMRGEQSLLDLGRNIITYLAKYLGAQIAVLYTLDEDSEGVMKLCASYALPKGLGVKPTIRIGEGLAGQAAFERTMILIANIPQDYVRITSAIGESLPRHILVVPFLFGDKLKGVAELGSFSEFSAIHQEFLNLVAESVAIAIHSAQSREKIQVLLEESQRQAEELQVQQKELQAANEELEEQTQALRESEERLKIQHEELQAANEELEERAKWQERQRVEIERKNSELEAARRELEKKTQELSLANRYKSEFLANMSHELRTPLNSLLILSQTLAENRDGNLTDRQVEALRIIHNSGKALLELINDILDLAKIESGRMDINPEEVSIQDLAKELISNFKHMAENKGLALEVTVDQSAPQLILTDRKRISQIMRNLISNAIKFTDKGGITIDIRKLDEQKSLPDGLIAPVLAIAVTDTGIGIPPEKQGIIFEAFQQAEGGTARKYGGTGLGLSISKNLANLLGGKVVLTRSEPEQGSTFTLYLPLRSGQAEKGAGSALAEPKSQPTVWPKPLGGESSAQQQLDAFQKTEAAAIVLQDDRDNLRPDDRSILIIEDDQNFGQILMDQCRARGFKCLFSSTGEVGLELAKKYLPKAIILDILLPGINGWQVMETLKREPATRHIPIHIMSVEEKTIYAFQKGAIGFLTKPATAEQMAEALGRIEKMIAKTIKDLLVVEDDPVSRANIVRIVGNSDVKVTEAGSGAEAIQAIKSKQYDCVVLDLGLPDMSGFQVLQALEREKGLVIPPIIIYTARELTKEEEEELRKYTESIIVKGVKSEERLLDETALFLHRLISNLPKNKQEMISLLYNQDSILTGKRILLVDDDMRNAFALAGVLQERGMKVFKAEDGQKALDILKKNPDIDLVLMDIMMPVMDGYEAIRKIRAQKKFLSLPIIALTAKAMREDREKCLAAGANDYLSKPIDVDRLISMMRVWLYR